MTPTLTFEVAGHDTVLTVADFDLVVAGYTGRDRDSVLRHIRELEEIGVAPPASVPAFYSLDRALTTQAEAIEAHGPNTSGEVEPVLLVVDGQRYLTVGSDHTDRDIERDSVRDSKAACPKPVGRTAIRLGDELRWDEIEVSSTVDGRPYQRERLRALTPILDTLATYLASATSSRDLVLFGGTVPIVDGVFVPGQDWTLELAVPDGATIRHRYAVNAAASY